MSEKEIETPVNEVQIKILFGKLTEVIIGSSSSKKDVIDRIGMVGDWSSLLIASLLVMLEKEPNSRSNYAVDRYTSVLNRNIKDKIDLVRSLSSEKKEQKPRIIVP